MTLHCTRCGGYALMPIRTRHRSWRSSQRLECIDCGARGTLRSSDDGQRTSGAIEDDGKRLAVPEVLQQR